MTVSILFNLQTQPPSLIAGWDDVLLLMSEYLGYGSDASLWTTTESAELERRINEAYRYILYPSTVPGEPLPHVWTWLEQITTLSTVKDDFDYTLPSDFGSLVGRFTYAASDGFGPIGNTSEQIVRELRQYSSASGRPSMCAIRWRAQTSGLNQLQEALFYPIPDAVYVLSYKYAVLAGRLQKTNPYPLGGPRVSQLLIEACKAIGESVKDGTGTQGPQWNVFRENLLAAIQMDKGTNQSPTVGRMVPQGYGVGPSYGNRSYVGSVSYSFGPGGVDGSGNAIADGAYSLEV